VDSRESLVPEDPPFDRWLRGQAHRKDRVGSLARVMAKDPEWPGGVSRAVVADYFRGQGAREFVMESVRLAWDEFEKQQRRARNRDKNRAAKTARKANRAKSRGRR
jgi:YozE SAM-like fold